MSPDEVRRLLTFAGGYGLPAPGDAELSAWHEALHQLDFDEAQFAVVVHYRESAAHVMPADIWNRCRVAGPVAPLIPLRARQAPDPERWHRMWQQAIEGAALECAERRAMVLGAERPEGDGSPPPRDRLCEPPLNFTKPGQWNGYIPPETFDGERNRSDRREALLAITEEARALAAVAAMAGEDS